MVVSKVIIRIEVTLHDLIPHSYQQQQLLLSNNLLYYML